jgi:hypothetical protein
VLFPTTHSFIRPKPTTFSRREQSKNKWASGAENPGFLQFRRRGLGSFHGFLINIITFSHTFDDFFTIYRLFLRLLYTVTYTIYIDFSSLAGNIIFTDDFRDYFKMI